MFGRKANMRGQHVLITGGSSGIGLALALEAVKLEANVTIVSRSETRLKAAKELLEGKAREHGTGSRIEYKAVDVTKAAQVSRRKAWVFINIFTDTAAQYIPKSLKFYPMKLYLLSLSLILFCFTCPIKLYWF